MRVRLKHRRLAEVLARRPISHNRWAQTLGLSSGHLSDLLSGRRKYPAEGTRRKLLDGLDLPFEELFEIHQPVARTSVPKKPAEPTRFVDASRDRPIESPGRAPGDNAMSTLFHDLRYAARGLLRSPTFTFAAILTLAIGIGSNTALFSLVDAVLWKPFPYHDDERLVVVQSANSERGLRWSNISLPDARDIGSESELLESFAAWDWEPYGLSGGDQPIRVGGTRVTAEFFDVLGVAPLDGRTFRVGEDQPGAERVVVLSEGLWKSYFGGEDVVGETVLINAAPTTIIGIMPAGTEYPDQTRLWVPMRLDLESAPRGSNFLGSIGRLRPGVEMAALDVEIETLGQRLASDYPQANRDRVYRAISLRDVLTSDVEPITLSMLGIVTFVLLIVCANVANLLLARGATREREVAIRRALGASNRRLVQLLLAEASLLAFAGGVVGFGLGWIGIDRLAAAISDRIPPWVSTSMDLRIVAYTLAITVFAGFLFSLFPMLQNFRFSLSSALPEGGQRQGVGVRGGRLRSLLVISEVALSLVLLVGAGLMIKSLLRLTSVDPGFEARGGLTVGLDLLSEVDAEPAERAVLFDRFLRRFESLPGVESVAGINHFPLKRRSGAVSVSLDGQSPEDARRNPAPQISLVTPDYFQAMGIPFLRGADFDSLLDVEGADEVIVSQDLAQALWPGEEAIGHRLRIGDSDPRWWTVIGIAGDIRHRGLDRERQPHLYLPYWTFAPARMTVIIRHSGDPASMAATVRAAAAEMDPHQPLHEIMSTGQVVEASVWQWRFFTSIAWLFGAVALVLAVIGVYGVMAYAVSQRTSEVGIRMALGAGRGQVTAMILRQGARLMLLGLAIGLPLAVGLSKLLSGFLYSIRVFEPVALSTAMLLLFLLALPALLVPARRAGRVDPASSLRAD